MSGRGATFKLNRTRFFPYFAFDQFTKFKRARKYLFLGMESTPIEFTIVAFSLLFSFAEQGNDGKEIFLPYFYQIVYGTQCHFRTNIISTVIQHG